MISASNHDGQLFVSTDDKPENKRLVAYVKNPDATENLEFNKYVYKRRMRTIEIVYC